MALQPGTTLGPYEIVSLIGAGGMGEVYRARDPRLNREVAIKVLPADRVSDADRRRRFVQEAHAASALNHPHIITIHEIESANGIDFIVMEYIRGKSLDALIPRHGMRLGEVLRIAIPVADALAAAHARGIIHRDLKPANVMVGTDGDVKVLDFGLAKLIGREDADEAQLTHTADMALSVPGMIAGTAAYMSPEQATGEKVDARSDIFSFGAMLYEMVTGVRAFTGSSAADTLSAVLRAQPKPPTTMVAGVPPDLEKVILRCLRKDPARRFQHMADANVALQEIKEDSESGSIAPTPLRRNRRVVSAVLIGSALLTAGFAGWLLWPRRQVDAPQRSIPLTAMSGHAMYPTFSPDSQQVAFAWQPEGQDNFDIYVKLVGLHDVRRLTTDPANDRFPSWSPDGTQVAFVRDGTHSSTIRLVSPIGGGERKLNDVAVLPWPIAWSPDGRYIAAAKEERTGDPGIYLLPVNGGEARPIARPGLACHTPAFSPDSRRLAYVSCKRTLDVIDLDTGLTPTGTPRTLTSEVPFVIFGTTWSHDGTSIIYGAIDAGAVMALWRVCVDGRSAPERIEVAGDGASWPAVAPSRNRLAFSRSLNASSPYRFQFDRPPQPLLTSTLAEGNLDFSPDARRIAYCANSTDAYEVWTAGADGSNPQQLTHGPGRWQCSPHWSPDGQQVAFDSMATDGSSHIWTIAADGGVPRQVTTDQGNQNVPSWSQDGQWIYYSWGEGMSRNIWRIHLADGQKQQLTSEGAVLEARESPDGKSLIYNQGRDRSLRSVPLGGGPPHQIVDCALGWATASAGLYYVACAPGSEWGGFNSALHLVGASGRDRVLGTLERFRSASPFGLAVSHDGKIIVYNRLLREGHDLMLIENVR